MYNNNSSNSHNHLLGSVTGQHHYRQQYHILSSSSISNDNTLLKYPSSSAINYPLLNSQQQYNPIMIPVPSSPMPPPPPPPQFLIGGGVGDDEFHVIDSGALVGGGGGDEGDDEFPRRDERLPQWSYQETRDFIEIRAQLEWDFSNAKRNKSLWEMVANRMRDRGHRRTVDQCKGKWKNLVNRYKGQEASDMENVQQCPFYNEMHALFTARASMIQQPHLESNTIGTSKGKKRVGNASVDQSHEEEFSEEQEDDEEEEETGYDHQDVKLGAPPKKREKRQKIEQAVKQPQSNNNYNIFVAGMQEIMMSFMEQQQRIDMQWRESMEKRAQEREIVEQEWREKMEKLEFERMMMEKAWREKEEQRRLREESRAAKRDELFTLLLNKLVPDNNNNN